MVGMLQELEEGSPDLDERPVYNRPLIYYFQLVQLVIVILFKLPSPSSALVPIRA